jgi:hypothetical protein
MKAINFFAKAYATIMGATLLTAVIYIVYKIVVNEVSYMYI